MKLFKFALFFFLSTVIVFGCTDKEDETAVTNKKPREAVNNTKNIPAAEINTADKKAPEFKLKNVDGKEVKLSDFKGKIVIIDFWATWCGPCRMGIPDLVSLQNEYKKDLVIVGISMDQFSGTADKVKGFMKEMKINYPVIFGNEKVVKDYGNIEAIPTTFIIDKKGNIVDKHVGLVPKEAYLEQIKTLL